MSVTEEVYKHVEIVDWSVTEHITIGVETA